jgi:hypothetical protein
MKDKKWTIIKWTIIVCLTIATYFFLKHTNKQRAIEAHNKTVKYTERAYKIGYIDGINSQCTTATQYLNYQWKIDSTNFDSLYIK